MSKIHITLLVVVAVFVSTALSQALASTPATTAASSPGRQISDLAHRLTHDEATIRDLSSKVHALQSRGRLTVTVRQGTSGLGTGANSDGGQALCQAGESVVGAGAGYGSTGADFPGDHLTYSQPITSPPGWIAGGVHETDETNGFEVFAICAR